MIGQEEVYQRIKKPFSRSLARILEITENAVIHFLALAESL